MHNFAVYVEVLPKGLLKCIDGSLRQIQDPGLTFVLLGKNSIMRLSVVQLISKKETGRARRLGRLAMRPIGNLIWFIFGGVLMGLAWWIIGLAAYVSVIAHRFTRKGFSTARTVLSLASLK